MPLLDSILATGIAIALDNVLAMVSAMLLVITLATGICHVAWQCIGNWYLSCCLSSPLQLVLVSAILLGSMLAIGIFHTTMLDIAVKKPPQIIKSNVGASVKHGFIRECIDNLKILVI